MRKLFVVVREDLTPGQQAVQGMHALHEYIFENPRKAADWRTTSSTLALLVVADEKALGVLYEKAIDRDVSVAPFREPDRNNELTAIALGPEAKKITQGLRLAYDSPPSPQSSHHGR